MRLFFNLQHTISRPASGCLLLLLAFAAPAETLRFGIATAPTTLHPLHAMDALSQRLCRLLYQRLTDFNERYEPVPSLATWEIISPRQYRLTLAGADHRFHDGSPLTMADVQATYNYVLDAGNVSPHRQSLRMLARTELINPRQLDFYLHYADPLFPGRLSLGIVSANALQHGRDLHRQPLGSGAMKFERQPDPLHLQLRRLTDNAQVEFITVADPTMRALKLVRGEIDLLQGDLAPEMIDWLAQRDMRVLQQTGDTVAYLGFNMQDTALASPAVREAIALALDREAIVRHLFRQRAQPAATILSARHWLATDLPVPAQDPARARMLLRQAGYDAAHPLKLRYTLSSDPLRVRIASLIQAQLREVGIEVSLESHDWATFFADVRAGRFQLYSLAWVGLKLPEIYRYAFHSQSLPPQGANRGRLQDAELDQLIEQAELMDSVSAQTAGFQQVAARLAELRPFIPLWYEDVVAVTRPEIADYPLAGDGRYDGILTAKRQSAVKVSHAH